MDVIEAAQKFRWSSLSILKRISIYALVAAVVFYIITMIVPEMALNWGYSGIKKLLYDDIGLGENISSFLALIGSFVYALLLYPLSMGAFRVAFGSFEPKRAATVFAAWILVYGHAPLLRALYGDNTCVNQRTGEPLKWYAVKPDGSIVLRDGSGFEADGTARRVATPQVCKIASLQKQGLQAHRISTDPKDLRFFSALGGPVVWYSRSPDGRLNLFDHEGVDPATGDLLLPVDKAIASESAAQFTRFASQKSKEELAVIFGAGSYGPGTILVGATGRKKNDVSRQAADLVAEQIVSGLHKKGLDTDEFRPAVVSGGYLAAIADGDALSLTESGVLQKTAGAVVAQTEAACRKASETTGLSSCTISVQIRSFSRSGAGAVRRASETGPGVGATQALGRAAEMIFERHPDLLDGLAIVAGH